MFLWKSSPLSSSQEVIADFGGDVPRADIAVHWKVIK